jgi:serine protease Do/serine protease DegQ
MADGPDVETWVEIAMRFRVIALTAFLALNQSAPAQVPPPSAMLGVTPQGVPTLAPLVKKVAPGVVNIGVTERIAQQHNPLFNDPFFRQFFNVPDIPAEREFRAAGSGVIVDAHEGLVITNRHVVEHADAVTVTLTDGRRLLDKSVGVDPETDIALIKVAAGNLVALPLGDSDKLEVGGEVCQRVLFLAHGKILLDGTPGRLTREYGAATLEDLFVSVAHEDRPLPDSTPGTR